ncbi:MAG: translation initiation factor IF-3 [bacterium]|nr:translation initiation factor IF-3 [bacterium]
MTKNDNRNNRIFINNNIRASRIRCIDNNDENLGIITKVQALSLAELAGLDLVQISNGDDIPICKIVDHGKYKYELSKKHRVQAKKQRESIVKTKEVKLRPNTEINDLKTKAKMARKFVEDGCRVKVVIYFKGRELQHKDLAPAKLDLFLNLMEMQLLKLSEPSFEGRTVSIIIAADKFKLKEKVA